MNAMWWVRYTDKKNPARGVQLLSLSSPDLSNPKKARQRAAKTAKERLRKRGVKPIVVEVRCVG